MQHIFLKQRYSYIAFLLHEGLKDIHIGNTEIRVSSCSHSSYKFRSYSTMTFNYTKPS